MESRFRDDIVAVHNIPSIETMLEEVCRMTGMGFAAVARVTSERWICCHVLDRIEFGMQPGDELTIKTTICDEIRASGQAVFIDHVGASDEWRTHHTPAMYGFESYVSLPIVRANGGFFGTLCAIDPAPCSVSLAGVMPELQEFARTIADALDRIQSPLAASPN